MDRIDGSEAAGSRHEDTAARNGEGALAGDRLALAGWAQDTSGGGDQYDDGGAVEDTLDRRLSLRGQTSNNSAMTELHCNRAKGKSRNRSRAHRERYAAANSNAASPTLQKAEGRRQKFDQFATPMHSVENGSER